ncbi:MAG: LytTR family DNA-binding domain-containing protein [Bacteroidota bacterium]
MKLRCMIVDDEPLAIKVLEKYMLELDSLQLVASCKNAIEALDILHNEVVDLIFLDINMPRLSGINMIKSMKSPPMVVFVTAYPEFAVEGFELDAVDYLMKPVAFDRFLKAVNKARKQSEAQNSSAKSSPTLMVRADKKLYKINWKDISFFQGYGDYVKVNTIDKTLVPKEKLSTYEDMLPSGFLRVHRSYIVNLDLISYMEGNQVKIGEHMIPIGQKYRELLLKELKK